MVLHRSSKYFRLESPSKYRFSFFDFWSLLDHLSGLDLQILYKVNFWLYKRFIYSDKKINSPYHLPTISVVKLVRQGAFPSPLRP